MRAVVNFCSFSANFLVPKKYNLNLKAACIISLQKFVSNTEQTSGYCWLTPGVDFTKLFSLISTVFSASKFARDVRHLPNLCTICQTPIAKKVSNLVRAKNLHANVDKIDPCSKFATFRVSKYDLKYVLFKILKKLILSFLVFWFSNLTERKTNFSLDYRTVWELPRSVVLNLFRWFCTFW